MKTLLHQFAAVMESIGGSDIHLLEGQKPRIRVRGDLRAIDSKDHPLVTREDIEQILSVCLTDEQKRTFAENQDIDFSIELGNASGRVNVGLANGRLLYLIMRYLPAQIIPLDLLGIDFDMLKSLSETGSGLILVVGETSSGKTTTIAAMLDYINRTRLGAINTIENPVEYVLHSDKCLITRREIGRDTPDFRTALRASVRKNPDVLLIGEIRDLETANIAITAAETGIQTFGTLHAMGAIEAVTRLSNIMAGEGSKEAEFYTRLASTLRGIISQRLMKRADGKGMLPIYQILNVSHAERQYLRDKDFGRLEQSLETERNISFGRCIHNLWHTHPRPINEDLIRRFYGLQFSIAMNRLDDKAYKPLVTMM